MAEEEVIESVIIPPYKRINIYTDGSCVNNGKENALAGLGIYIRFVDESDNYIEDSDIYISEAVPSEMKQTNNVGELYAIIRTFECLEEYGIETKREINTKKEEFPITVYTDSKYCINCLNNFGFKCHIGGWRKDIPNKELVKRAFTEMMKHKSIEYKYIKGHSKNTDEHSYGNNIADELAKNGLTYHN